MSDQKKPRTTHKRFERIAVLIGTRLLKKMPETERVDIAHTASLLSSWMWDGNAPSPGREFGPTARAFDRHCQFIEKCMSKLSQQDRELIASAASAVHYLAKSTTLPPAGPAGQRPDSKETP
jgi:hypothetical protein